LYNPNVSAETFCEKDTPEAPLTSGRFRASDKLIASQFVIESEPLPQTNRPEIGTRTENRPESHDLNHGRPRENATTAM